MKLALLTTLQRSPAWIHLLLFKLSWVLLVVGQERGLPWALALQLLALLLCRDLLRVLPPALCVAIGGIVVDWLCLQGGLFQFPAAALPPWLILLWLAFGLALQRGLQFLQRLPLLLQVLVGMLLGPLGYGLGARFDAVSFGLPLLQALLVLAVLWGALLPLALRAAHLQKRPVLAASLLFAGLLAPMTPNQVLAYTDSGEPGLMQLGQARLQWLWRPIYEASLHATTRDFEFPASTPYTLRLHYRIDVRGAQLLAETQRQWQQQKISAPVAWLDTLRTLLPDVQDGDSLALQVEPDGRAGLLHNDRLLGRIDNPDLVSAFAGIWLADTTTQPRLRRQLLGVSP